MNKIWTVNDSIHCQQLSSDYLQEALDFLDKAFYPHENVCKTLEISKDPEALKELRQLTTATAYDGVTVIAIDKKINRIVGAAFNKMQVRDTPVFENFAKSWKNRKSQALVQFMADIDNICNLFDFCKTDCIFELMFLATLPEYKGRGIGRKLTEASIEIGSNLAKGINVKKSLNNEDLTVGPRPKIISAIFTSFITQKIGRQLKFETAAEKNYDELEYEGRKYSSIVGSATPKLTLEYKYL